MTDRPGPYYWQRGRSVEFIKKVFELAAQSPDRSKEDIARMLVETGQLYE